MRHHYINNENTMSGDHWAVGANSSQAKVLLQVQSNGEQVRISITKAQALELAAELKKLADQ